MFDSETVHYSVGTGQNSVVVVVVVVAAAAAAAADFGLQRCREMHYLKSAEE